MKLFDLGGSATLQWFQQILSWSRNKITFWDNIDGVFWTGRIGTTETEIGHTLGRVPRYIFEVASYPNGTAGINFTKAPTNEKIFMKRGTDGQCTLFIT